MDEEVFEPSDLLWMQRALELAQNAAQQGEVPVGALLVDGQNNLVAEGWNRPIGNCDPTAHAEIEVLRQAAQRLGNYRLPEATLYVTLEPCAMCAGAIIHARLARVVFGAFDPKGGAAGSCFNLLQSEKLNHRCVTTGGIMEQQAAVQLKEFFHSRRQKKRPQNNTEGM
jgi:tRNA(adenine34) deaminase